MIRERSVLWLLVTFAASGWYGDHLEGQGFSECHALIAEDPEAQESSRCFYEEGLEGNRPQASTHLKALATAHPNVGWPHFYLASLHWSETADGIEYLGRAIERFRQSGDTPGEALARGNRQQLLFRLGRLAEAGQDAELAASLGQSSGDSELAAWSQLVLVRHLVSISSDLERAYAILGRVEAQLTSESPYLIRRNAVANRARVAIEIGRHGEAEDAFKRLLTLASEVDDPFSEATAWYGLTRILIDRFGQGGVPELRSRALETAQNALRASRAAGHSDIEGKAHWVLGVLSSPEEAREHFERCRQVAPTPRDRGYCLNALARRLAATDPGAADRLIEEALALAEGAGDPYSQAFAWGERMRVSWAVEPVDRAITDSWAALDRIETLRDLQEDGSEVQAGLFSTWADDYHWFGGRLLEEARETGRVDLVAEAFAVSERLRARALTDWLHATGQAPSASEAGGFASLREVQRALGPREALLAFQVAPWEDLAGDFGGGSWLIAVTRSSAWAYPLPGRREIRHAVDLYTGLFEGRDGSEAAPSAPLYRQLLAPALADLPAGTDRLILVPDDALHRLPFGALRPGAGAPPLAATHRLSVAPSASLWLGWRRGGPAGDVVQASHDGPGRAPALVLAAPAVGEGSPVPGDADLPPLRHARREGRAVAATLGRGTELALGAAASEGRLGRPDLDRFGVLHLAAHAVTDEEHPERSAVVLAPSAAGPPPGRVPGEDGLLRAGEIASLDLGGKLVVLSSCRSAAGTVLRGEGVMSLGRAFFQAGARTVVASLWPVRDDEAAVLFESFYRHLARGETVTAALHAAQAERRSAGAPASAWAAFVALGDGDLAPVAPPPPPDPGVRVALIAGIFATLLLALAAVSLRHRLAAALTARRPRSQDFPGLAPSSPSPR